MSWVEINLALCSKSLSDNEFSCSHYSLRSYRVCTGRVSCLRWRSILYTLTQYPLYTSTVSSIHWHSILLYTLTQYPLYMTQEPPYTDTVTPINWHRNPYTLTQEPPYHDTVSHKPRPPNIQARTTAPTHNAKVHTTNWNSTHYTLKKKNINMNTSK